MTTAKTTTLMRAFTLRDAMTAKADRDPDQKIGFRDFLRDRYGETGIG